MHDDDEPMPKGERVGLDGDIEKTCQNCRYYAANGGSSDQGDCRRHAPGPSNIRIRKMDESSVRIESWWPVMNDDDWCGEFEAIEEEWRP